MAMIMVPKDKATLRTGAWNKPNAPVVKKKGG